MVLNQSDYKTKVLKIREFRRDKKNCKIPAIILQGKQLEEYGFILDKNVVVTFSDGIITIKPYN